MAGCLASSWSTKLRNSCGATVSETLKKEPTEVTTSWTRSSSRCRAVPAFLARSVNSASMWSSFQFLTTVKRMTERIRPAMKIMKRGTSRHPVSGAGMFSLKLLLSFMFTFQHWAREPTNVPLTGPIASWLLCYVRVRFLQDNVSKEGGKIKLFDIEN